MAIDTHGHKRITFDTMPAIKYYTPTSTGFILGFETDYGWYAYIIQEDPPNGQYEILNTMIFDTQKELLDELDRRYGKLEQEQIND